MTQLLTSLKGSLSMKSTVRTWIASVIILGILVTAIFVAGNWDQIAFSNNWNRWIRSWRTSSVGTVLVPIPSRSPDDYKVWIGQYEIRRHEYGQFLLNTGRDMTHEPHDLSFFEPQHQYLPANRVSYFDARRFCMWLTQRDRALKVIGEDEEYDLPFDDEWLVAAGVPLSALPPPDLSPKDRSEKRTTYAQYFPWPKSGQIPAKANILRGQEVVAAGKQAEWDAITKPQNKVEGTDDSPSLRAAPAPNTEPNQFGIFDMDGNLLEWIKEPQDRREFYIIDDKTVCVRHGPSFKTINTDDMGVYKYFFADSDFSKRTTLKEEEADITGFRIVLRKYLRGKK